MKNKGVGRVFYVGLDESNHGRSPEIVVAVSSLINSDAYPGITSKKMRIEEDALAKFFGNSGRDFRYASVPRKRGTKTGVVENIAPVLVEELLAEHRKDEFTLLEMLIDGEGKESESTALGKTLHGYAQKKGIGSIRVRYYPKSGSSYKYPKILVVADSLAHYLFRQESFKQKVDAEQKRVDF